MNGNKYDARPWRTEVLVCLDRHGKPMLASHRKRIRW